MVIEREYHALRRAAGPALLLQGARRREPAQDHRRARQPGIERPGAGGAARAEGADGVPSPGGAEGAGPGPPTARRQFPLVVARSGRAGGAQPPDRDPRRDRDARRRYRDRRLGPARARQFPARAGPRRRSRYRRRASDAWDRRVRDNFLLADGRLKEIPASRKKRWVILRFLVEQFEADRRYPEGELNEILKRHHWDSATLRREMIGYRMMARDHGVYWRLPEDAWLPA